MKNQNDFINEMDDGYIDIESCFDPVFEPPAELLEEWSRRYEGPEPTLENTSFYVVGPETSCQGLFIKKISNSIICCTMLVVYVIWLYN